MGYKDLEIERSYISYGDNNISKALVVPALKCSKVYKRSVGFFSSSVFEVILDGIEGLARSGGKIQLLASPNLSSEDIQAIEVGYEKREEIIKNSFFNSFTEELMKFDIDDLDLISQLIAASILDIKLVVPDGLGIYHDKLAIMKDFNNDTIVFFGSANESKNAYKNNYEKIRVFKSWVDVESQYVNDEVKEFDLLWSGQNKYNKTIEFKDALYSNVIKILENKKANQKNEPIVLRDYQSEAIEAWVNNGYRGFYVMATGTGKTWTAIYSAKRLLKNKDAMLVICAPYKHLIQQWAEDLEKVFTDAVIIKVSSENANWQNQLDEEILRKKYGDKKQIIVVSTIISFNLDRFKKTINKSNEERMLIVDEAHRFSNRPDHIKMEYKYMLGLSATPVSRGNIEKAQELMNFFGGKVYDLPIEIALEKGFLVPYNYYPIFVSATEDEEKAFRLQQRIIASCFKNGVCIDVDRLNKALRSKLRVIAMASEKTDNINKILDNVVEKDHFIVYCGDGRLYDDIGNELRHINFVKNELDKKGYKPSQFTASENMLQRMELVEDFNKGVISALAAIRCLDEGINIPSIKSALILASNDDYREFVQRRGRILRRHGKKEFANIYDVVVVPSSDTPDIALIELKRIYEYARLSINKKENFILFDDLRERFNLSLNDIVNKPDESKEEALDE